MNKAIPIIIRELLATGAVEGYENGNQAVTAWGSSKFVGNEHEDSYGLGWLKFKVHGTLFKGFVRIISKYNKLYDISLEGFHNKTGENTIFHKFENIEGTNLSQILDTTIEGSLTKSV